MDPVEGEAKEKKEQPQRREGKERESLSNRKAIYMVGERAEAGYKLLSCRNCGDVR